MEHKKKIKKEKQDMSGAKENINEAKKKSDVAIIKKAVKYKRSKRRKDKRE